MLGSLQAVNLFWLSLILRIARNYVFKRDWVDERSEGETEEEVEVAPATGGAGVETKVEGGKEHPDRMNGDASGSGTKMVDHERSGLGTADGLTEEGGINDAARLRAVNGNRGSRPMDVIVVEDEGRRR